MKKLSVYYLVILFLGCNIPSVFATNPPALKPGDPAPKFVLSQMGGDKVFLSDYCGKKLRQPWKNIIKYPVVLSFFSTTCEPCKVEIPILQEIAKSYPDSSVKFFLICVGEEEAKVKAFVEKQGYTLPVLLDQFMLVSKNYGNPQKVPKLTLIDKEGNIVMFEEGYSEKNMEELKKLLVKVTK